ncbi:cysteine dioxygenase [Herminiimonas sp. NPDC097707]|uniref:cysteine dioxygenase family protein n=1 Tax=Herminiimonas sp. NPDC097707 TaxID=3364007 RepID=UPI00383AFFF5
MSTSKRKEMNMQPIPRLHELVDTLTDLFGGMDARNEQQKLVIAGDALKTLVGTDDWLPDEFAQPHPQYYQQYLLYCDPQQRFSIVSFVWGPGQTTPIHDHKVWALIGMLRGAERGERFVAGSLGQPMQCIGTDILVQGEIESLSPASGDIHRVSNADANRVSISIHVYGGDIGQIKRHVYDQETGQMREFISGYANR